MPNYAASIPHSGTITSSQIIGYDSLRGRTGYNGTNFIQLTSSNIIQVIEGGSPTVLVFRGVSGGAYVFSEGSPPSGATQVTIIGTK